nr:ABC transporter ATP-binding protein [Geodermatophilaceae bacterium]
GDGTFTMLTGGVQDYLARSSGRGSQRQTGSRPAASASGGEARSSGRAAQRRTAGKELARIERQLVRVDARESRLHAELAEHASDFSRVSVLDAELRELLADKARLEEDWLQTAAQAEAPDR